MSVDLILSRLERVTGRNGRWRSRCPSCGGQNQSKLSIAEGTNGAVLLKCWSGCDVHQIVSAVGLDLDALFPPRVDDQDRKFRIDRPFKRDALINLKNNLSLAWILLQDVGANKRMTATDRQSAIKCAQACADALNEIS